MTIWQATYGADCCLFSICLDAHRKITVCVRERERDKKKRKRRLMNDWDLNHKLVCILQSIKPPRLNMIKLSTA
jgi:hypothetical protein